MPGLTVPNRNALSLPNSRYYYDADDPSPQWKPGPYGLAMDSGEFSAMVESLVSAVEKSVPRSNYAPHQARYMFEKARQLAETNSSMEAIRSEVGRLTFHKNQGELDVLRKMAAEIDEDKVVLEYDSEQFLHECRSTLLNVALAYFVEFAFDDLHQQPHKRRAPRMNGLGNKKAATVKTAEPEDSG